MEVRAHRLFGVVGPHVLPGRDELGACQRHTGDVELLLEVGDIPDQAKPPTEDPSPRALWVGIWLLGSVKLHLLDSAMVLSRRHSVVLEVTRLWLLLVGNVLMACGAVVHFSQLSSASMDSFNPPVCVDLCFGFCSAAKR